jgi:hypothetical protein
MSAEVTGRRVAACGFPASVSDWGTGGLGDWEE